MAKIKKAEEQLLSQTNADETSTHNSNYGREHLEGTPFVIVNNDDGYFLTMGKYRMSETMGCREDVIYYMEEEMWTIMANMVVAILDHNKKIQL